MKVELHKGVCSCGWHGRRLRDAGAAQWAAARHAQRCGFRGHDTDVVAVPVGWL